VDFSEILSVSEGTHANIYRVTIREGADTAHFCLKLFKQGWTTPFNLEKTAYEHLIAAEVKDCIPKIYGYAARTLYDWGLAGDDSDDELYNGILMEWLEGGQMVSVNNITLTNACSLLEALDRIHKAGVLHFDPFRHNQIVFPGTRRVVWIDFSCAHMNEEYAQPFEMGDVAGILLSLVFIR